MVFNSHEGAADAWLGGDSPWVRRIIGITPAPQVGSLYNEGIWDSDAAVWRGKDVVRTTESDHAQRTSFLLGTPSLKAAGCSVEPVVGIARCRVVMCILHCCMAMGRLQMTNIERLAAVRLAGGDEVSRPAIQAVLHEHRTGCRLGKERRQNVAGTGCWNVAGTRCLGRVGLSPASLFAGRDDRDRGPGGSTGCTTPASPTGSTGGHALRATQQLCAGFASPSPTSGRSQTSSVGNPRSPAIGAATACPTRGRASCASPSASPPVARALDWEPNE